MKLFCAYAFTGENLEKVNERMRLVIDTLDQSGHEAYCNLFDEYRHTLVGPKPICMYAFETLKKYDALVAIVSSDRRSEGQLMEIGAAFALQKPVYLMQHQSAVGKSYVPELAGETFVWNTNEELVEALKRLGAALE